MEPLHLGPPRAIGEGQSVLGLDQALRVHRDARCGHS